MKRNGDGSVSFSSPHHGADAGAFFTSYNKDGRFISYYGDNHPLYAGNVVKAMASARDGYPHVTALFQDELAALDPDKQEERDSSWKRSDDASGQSNFRRVSPRCAVSRRPSLK